MKSFIIMDTRDVWYKDAIAAAQRAGYGYAQRITSADQVGDRTYDLGFIRPHATPSVLKRNQEVDFPVMRGACTKMVQDWDQVRTYEDKKRQMDMFCAADLGGDMPMTFHSTDLEQIVEILESSSRMTWVSKAKEGASSTNVRVLDKAAMIKHAREVFSKGVKVHHCDSKGTTSIQKGYMLLQEFIPHTFTWRINRIGDAYAIFHRFNYKDRAVAQTGNVNPIITAPPSHSNQMFLKALQFAEYVTARLGTRWVALDVLSWADKMYLLETSLAWPWPSPGDCDQAGFFRADGTPVEGYSWNGIGPGGEGNMFDLMFDAVERGAI